MKHKLKWIRWGIGAVLIVIFFLLLWKFGEKELWKNTFLFLLQHPVQLILGFFVYFLSFVLKAIAWTWTLQSKISIKTAIVGIWYSLFFNHLLPVKGGEVARIYVGYNRRRKGSLSEIIQSVALLRLFDLFSLLCLSLFFGFAVISKLSSYWILVVVGGILVVLVSLPLMLKWPSVFQRQWLIFRQLFFRRQIIFVFALVFTSWILEGSILFSVMYAIMPDFTFWNAVVTNSVTVLGQIFQITPGGIANYETVMSVTLRTYGILFEIGLFAAIITHGMKFLFSYLVGGIAWYLDPISYKQIKSFSLTDEERNG
ncbi:lysylphosphatidylglycerol synthase transmembrane domain-containing protein [Bacillus spongiae]|uniref:Phosphatidylglycerol lysyltransferase n=1 Tax=Bacillus spongiae TaxID=2683610 RepID=A0ABU8H8E8_9BACI